ncbi:hypothetical protein B0F90DRAFT_886832 [Multifurca ochricompacta]|uniref:DUF6534 domain-containing protein n=1 Tax=Multifurca ochricompacta TaxID=376703 RepID=A0AAD4QLU6_9AGAM|nr:hypothetical protein B0F90DRAFT_886832 [Multifurca ochricompacta]
MPSLIPVDNVLGAFLIGVALSSILYGVTCLQVYSYFSRHCENDRLFLKFFVAVLLILDSLHQALITHGYYIVGVKNFVQSLIGIILAGAIQQFYAWRIYRLSMGKIYVPIFIGITSLAELVLEIVYLIQCFRYPYYNQATVQIPISISGLVLQVLCDLVITTSMVYYLLVRYAKVMHGALTLIFAVSCLVTFARLSRTLIYAPFFFILVRLYSCAFMAILNSRHHLRTTLDSDAEKGTVIVISQRAPTPVPGRDRTSTNPGAGSGTANRTTLDITAFPEKVGVLRFADDQGKSLDTLEPAKYTPSEL